MKRSALTMLCLILILATKTFAQGQSSASLNESTEKKRFSAEWRLSMSGTDSNDEQNQAKYVDLRLELKSKYILTQSLFVDLQPAIRLITGQTQTVSGADAMDNRIILNQAAVHFTPIRYLRLSAGALDQSASHANILIDKMAFPGARMEVRVNMARAFSTGLLAETAIPTSNSLSTNTQDKEPTPSFNSASVYFNYTPSKDIFWKNMIGYFSYQNLPSSVAQKSMLLGNEVNEISEAHYGFINEFAGIEASSKLQLPIVSLLDLELGAEYLKNQKAADDVNTGYMGFAGVNLHITSNLDLRVRGGYASVAPEAAVSYFNAGSFETNRVGYFAGSSVTFKKEGFTLGTRYTESDVMFTSPVQSHDKSIKIYLETSYADI